MLTIERSLNIYAAGIPQIISLSQYDDDFRLVFSLYTSEGEFTIPSGTTAEVMGTKVDGNGYSASASISGSTVTVTGNKQMTACAGRNVYEIVLTQSGKRLATVNFILKVERAALDADTIQSETVLKELNAIIDSAATATEAAETATAAAESAAESARTMTIDPTLTQSGQAADAKATGDVIGAISEGGTDITVGKSTFHKLDVYIVGDSSKLASDTHCKTAYFACEPNTTYTINKVVSARFRVGYTITTPADTVAVYDLQQNNAATSLVVTTGSDAQYVVVYYYDSANDTLSESAIYDSLQVTYKGGTPTAVDRVARDAITKITSGLSDEAKVALLTCFNHVYWDDDHGQDYYDALRSALYPREYPMITAVFNAGSNVIYTDNTLNSLKQYLTVRYFETEESAGTVVPSANYTLSGELIEGTSTIYVAYNDLRTSFAINNVVNSYTIMERSLSNGLMSLRQGGVGQTSGGDARIVDYSQNYPRYSTYVTRGKRGMFASDETTLTNYYPIPVPSGATTAKVDITPNTQYFALQQFSYNEITEIYNKEKDSGWQISGTTIQLELDKNVKFATMNLKCNSAGTSYPVVPTDVKITFE